MSTKKNTDDFLNQTRSSYNRQSGEKTLMLVGILILIVVIFSVAILLTL